MNESIEQFVVCKPHESYSTEWSYDSWHVVEDSYGNRFCAEWARGTMGPFGKMDEHVWWDSGDRGYYTAEQAGEMGWKYIKPVDLY